jgi:RNA polymerase sigma-32 factor
MTGLHRPFVRAAMQAPYLTREQERDFAIAWRDRQDRAALERIVSAHLRLVIAIAGRFRNYGLPMPDLIQEGNIGLMQAAERFDISRDVRFSTYASWWIRAAIQEYVLKNWSIVRGGTSSAQKALFFNLRRLKADIARRIAEGEMLDEAQEIAQKLNVSRADVVQMDMRLSGSDISLDITPADLDSDAPARVTTLAADGPLPDEITAAAIDGERRETWLKAALSALSDRERHVVQARRLAEPSATLESLGAKLGVSKERVRQIEARALEKLRSTLLRKAPAMAGA